MSEDEKSNLKLIGKNQEDLKVIILPPAKKKLSHNFYLKFHHI